MPEFWICSSPEIETATAACSVALLRERWPEAELIVNADNVGFGRANNQALPRLRGRHVLLLNTDAFVADNYAELKARRVFAAGVPRELELLVRLIGRAVGTPEVLKAYAIAQIERAARSLAIACAMTFLARSL